jgi:hypothetical protein
MNVNIRIGNIILNSAARRGMTASTGAEVEIFIETTVARSPMSQALSQCTQTFVMEALSGMGYLEKSIQICLSGGKPETPDSPTFVEQEFDSQFPEDSSPQQAADKIVALCRRAQQMIDIIISFTRKDYDFIVMDGCDCGEQSKYELQKAELEKLITVVNKYKTNTNKGEKIIEKASAEDQMIIETSLKVFDNVDIDLNKFSKHCKDQIHKQQVLVYETCIEKSGFSADCRQKKRDMRKKFRKVTEITRQLKIKIRISEANQIQDQHRDEVAAMFESFDYSLSTARYYVNDDSSWSFYYTRLGFLELDIYRKEMGDILPQVVSDITVTVHTVNQQTVEHEDRCIKDYDGNSTELENEIDDGKEILFSIYFSF